MKGGGSSRDPPLTHRRPTGDPLPQRDSHGRLWPNRLWPIVVLTDFGQFWCFSVLANCCCCCCVVVLCCCFVLLLCCCCVAVLCCCFVLLLCCFVVLLSCCCVLWCGVVWCGVVWCVVVCPTCSGFGVVVVVVVMVVAGLDFPGPSSAGIVADFGQSNGPIHFWPSCLASQFWPIHFWPKLEVSGLGQSNFGQSIFCVVVLWLVLVWVSVFLCCAVCCFVLLVCVWWVCSRPLCRTPSAGPPFAGPPSAGPPKISLFFFPSPATIFILFSLSCWSFSLNFGGVFEDRDPQMCTWLSGCRVKPWRPHQTGPPGLAHDSPRTPNVHI